MTSLPSRSGRKLRKQELREKHGVPGRASWDAEAPVVSEPEEEIDEDDLDAMVRRSIERFGA